MTPLNQKTNEDLNDLEKQLEHNLAALFLKMQTVLHIPESTVKEVIQQLLQMCELSQPLQHNALKDILKQHTDVDDSVVEVSQGCRKEKCDHEILWQGWPLINNKKESSICE